MITDTLFSLCESHFWSIISGTDKTFGKRKLQLIGNWEFINFPWDSMTSSCLVIAVLLNSLRNHIVGLYCNVCTFSLSWYIQHIYEWTLVRNAKGMSALSGWIKSLLKFDLNTPSNIGNSLMSSSNHSECILSEVIKTLCLW